MTSKGEKLTLLERARQTRPGYGSTSMWDWSKTDLLRPKRWYDLSYQEFCEEAILEDAIVVECWKSMNEETISDFTPPKDTAKYIKEDSISVWLEESPRDNWPPCAGLRLIHKFQPDMRENPFNIETIAAINEKFSLPDVISCHTTSFTGACGKFISIDSTSVIFVIKSTFAAYTCRTVVRHDFETATTVGYILSGPSTPMHHVLLRIPTQFRALMHPLLIPVLIGEQMLEEATFDLDTVDSMIADIEEGTGFNDYAPIEPDSGQSDCFQDYRALSRNLGKVASKFAGTKSAILGIKAMYEFLSQELKSYQSWIPEEKWQDYTESTRTLIERAGYTTSHIEHSLLYRGIEMRLQVQQSVIFNLIAQEDNRTNIQLSNEMRRIAIKTKRDGSIMKTIAFLGALFVPATFVSTLFAMPLFNWSAPTTSEIITNHFWIYGAVTGPLTVVTMAIVGYWILSRTQKNLDNKDPTSDEPRPSRFAPLKQKLKLRKRRSFRTEDSV